MPEHYGESTTKKGNARKGKPAGSRLAFDDTMQEAEKKKNDSPTPMVKKGGMTDKQKADLTKHMEKVGKSMSATEKKSHRMKMMSRMRKGMSVKEAHKDVK